VSDEDREKWEARYAEASAAPAIPSVHLTNLDHLLPRTGRALDVAGGAGRHALWLAARGLQTTLVDIAPRALAIAQSRAQEQGLHLDTHCVDLETDALPEGPFDVIVSMHFLLRSLWPSMRVALAPGGWLVVVQPTIANLERHARPPAAFLLAPGEAREMVAGLEIVSYAEGWSLEGRHEAVVVARRSS
jgi:tellurite methyltransferase